ncbi:IclR family transcriptional regulator [Glutamicibacter protophormiae]|uniref:IclR family transcriptional regulator n=1 Tax=Glutamicibacter protophormiae TaxID=37930 RepID=UPI0033323F9D
MPAVKHDEQPSVRPETPGESRGASVIVNVIDVLRCFSVERPALGVTDIAAEVGLHKSSVSRILATLEQERIVERDDQTRKYRLGLALIAIAGPLLANLDVRQVAYPLLQELRDSTEESAILSIWDGSESVSVEQLPSARLVKHTSVLGSRYRTGLSASVQMFLAHQPTDTVRALIDAGKIQLPQVMAAEDYLPRLEAVRRRGYSINYGETSRDEVSVAAPVFDHRGDVVAAAMIAAPYYRVSSEELDQLCTQTVRTAKQISARMGYQPQD